MVFMMLILGIIYVFQINFMDVFYENSKIEDMERVLSTLDSALDDDDLKNVVNEIGFETNACVAIKNSSSMSEYVSQSENEYCSLNYLSSNQFDTMFDESKANGGSGLFVIRHLDLNNRDFYDDNLRALTRIVNHDGVEYMLVVSDTIEPLPSVTSTIQLQFFYIIIFVVIITIILALLLSILFKPLKKINEEAKTLPDGVYDGDDVHSLIQEMDDINDTLKESCVAIKQADVARKELLSNVSHDLRTPLTMIVGYGEMMIDFDEEKTNDNIKLIIDEANRLSNLVNDLLDLSKAELGKLDLDMQDVSLNEFLTSVYNQYRLYLENQNIEFTLDLDRDIFCRFDDARMRQVLYNFINNAMNYNDKEDPKILIKTEYSEGEVTVSVIDNGKGIEQEDIDKIWERYYKVDREHKRQLIGSGIGLSLAKMILEGHHFQYGVESKIGEYSRFYFKIKEADSSEE